VVSSWGAKLCFLSSLRINRKAARVSRRRWGFAIASPNADDPPPESHKSTKIGITNRQKAGLLAAVFGEIDYFSLPQSPIRLNALAVLHGRLDTGRY
jgi:hypothetical protein